MIIDDLQSGYIQKIETYNVVIIPYSDVMHQEFTDILNVNLHKFCIVDTLIGREKLFIYSFERFFLLKNLMEKENLIDCLFLELDNLLYDNPEKWLEKFSRSELCYMFDNYDRCSSGIMYIKNKKSIDGFLSYCLDYISVSTEFMTEMTCLYRYYTVLDKGKSVQMLPIFWKDESVPIEAHHEYNNYQETIFDAAAMGIYLLGHDPHHHKGKIVRGLKSPGSYIDYTNLKFEWKLDDSGLNKPYVWNGEKWLLINNLHVHSKDLASGLSRSI